MVHKSMKNLEFDRRLYGRRGWISEKEFENHLANLPDVTSKGEVVVDADESASAPEAGAGQAPAPAPQPLPGS